MPRGGKFRVKKTIGWMAFVSMLAWGVLPTLAADGPSPFDLGIKPPQAPAAQPVFSAESAADNTPHSQPVYLTENMPQTPVPAEADPIKGVRIEGNQRVEADTIRTYLGLHEGSKFDATTIDKALKDLYATGFFSDVKLLRDGDVLVVKVAENPVISRVAFEGNSKIETKDLEKEVELKARSVFTRSKVQSDVNRILNIYRKSGRYSATVQPKVIQLDQNRVDLVYEIVEGPVARIQKISFIGNDHFGYNDLLDVIKTEETRWWRFLSDNDKYDSDRLQYDQELLRKFYTSQGYADFLVKSAHAELSPNKDGFYITFVLSEGVKYTLSKVDVKSEIKGAENIQFGDLITTHPGQDYNSSRIEESIDAITKELGNRGYAFVDIQPRLVRDKTNNTIALTYDIKPGPRVYIERINITGNVRTLDEVIRREFRFAEGDPYNAAKIARTEERLNGLGYFEKVKITNEPGSAPDKTIINVDVKEKSTGEVNIGAGFSSTDGALANIGFKESNFLGRGQQVTAQLTVAQLEKQEQIGFTEPYFLGRQLALGFDLFHTELDYQTNSTYNLDSEGFNIHMTYALTEHLNHTVYYSLRQNDISNIQSDASIYIVEQAGKEINSAVGHALIYDMRNNSKDPTNGYYFKVSQEFAGLGGDSNYIKHELRASYYIPEAKEWTFTVGGAAGDIYGLKNGPDNTFIADRFFIGGDLIRGFQNAGIGPHDEATRDALGGNKYYVGSVEQQFPSGLPDDVGLKGAVFTDVGSLWGVSGPGIGGASPNPRVSVGFGILWNSPFGPVRIDIAEPVIKQSTDQNELFRFDFGTHF